MYTPSDTSGYYSSSDSNDARLQRGNRNIYPIKKAICGIMPSALRVNDNEICARSLKILTLSPGSLNVDFRVDSNVIGTSAEAQSAVLSSMSTNTIPGATIIKSSSSGT